MAGILLVPGVDGLVTLLLVVNIEDIHSHFECLPLAALSSSLLGGSVVCASLIVLDTTLTTRSILVTRAASDTPRVAEVTCFTDPLDLKWS